MANKPALSVADQISLLKSRGMLFDDEPQAIHFLKNVSYYRLKGYWWDQQVDSSHNLKPDTYFDDIIIRYNFDRHLRLILFDAIERIEIALRTKMKEFNRSQEVFIEDQRARFPHDSADAWKIMEVASMGTLSKIYKNLAPQLPEKAAIAREMGLNLHSELSSLNPTIPIYKPGFLNNWNSQPIWQ